LLISRTAFWRRLHQLCPRTPVEPEKRLYNYDNIGNRKTAATGADQETYTSNELNQYTEISSASLFFDEDGNLGQLVNAETGSLAASYRYDPFGRLISVDASGNNPFRFSTKYFDGESGLYYYGYRYYSSEMGRWINRDPIQENGGVNIFAYLVNNTVNKIDPNVVLV
jgi:RHS repeat-associated protein